MNWRHFSWDFTPREPQRYETADIRGQSKLPLDQNTSGGAWAVRGSIGAEIAFGFWSEEYARISGLLPCAMFHKRCSLECFAPPRIYVRTYVGL